MGQTFSTACCVRSVHHGRLSAVNLSSNATSQKINKRHIMEASSLAPDAVLAANAIVARLLIDAKPDSLPYLLTHPFSLNFFFLQKVATWTDRLPYLYTHPFFRKTPFCSVDVALLATGSSSAAPAQRKFVSLAARALQFSNAFASSCQVNSQLVCRGTKMFLPLALP